MRFDERIFDGSDPLYAPGISWTGIYPRWKCPKKFTDMGYATTSAKIEPAGDRNDEHQPARALQCRQHMQAVKRWYDSIGAPKVEPGTWHWLIGRYRGDDISPMQEVKGNTRQGYLDQLKRLDNAIGHMQISDLRFETIKEIERVMRDKGRSNYSIKVFFQTVRRVAGYGSALGNEEARNVKFILGEMRFKSSPSRTVFPTREQVEAIVGKAVEDGNLHFALGTLLQFELALRAADVRGLWLRDGRAGTGIRRNGRRWADGLTWDMVGDNFSSITKVISKTASSRPEPVFFDLTPLPKVRELLAQVSEINNVGPVIISTTRDNMPYTSSGWRFAWNRYRDAAGVPRNIQVRDLRAGAITEAKQLGASAYAVRDLAGHATTEMTDRYARDRNTAEVIELRQSRGKA